MIEELLNTTATVKAATNTVNAVGGISRSFADSIIDEPCRLSKQGLTELDVNGKRSLVNQWKVFFAYTAANAAIATSSQIVVNSRTLQVLTVHNPNTLNHHVEVECLEVV